MNDFVPHRPMLLGLAYRLTGSRQDAEDVLQEAYLRWSRVDRTTVAEPRRYLTRVVARLALDALRARRARRETYPGPWLPEPVATAESPFDAVDTSDLSLAVLHLLERLTPPQRAVYVLHDAFELPYQEIGEILGRAADDCRQLHRRAVAAVRAGRPRFTAGPAEHRRLLAAFVAAARDGDLPRLESLLHADVVAYTDGGGRTRAALHPVSGAARVSRMFAGIYAKFATAGPVTAELVELNGAPAVVVTRPQGRHVIGLAIDGGAITGIYLVANPEKLAALDTAQRAPV